MRKVPWAQFRTASFAGALAFAIGCSAYDPALLSESQANVAVDAAQPVVDSSTPAVDASDAAFIATECSDNPDDPTCTRAHAQTVCAGGACFIADCEAPFVDCDRDPDTGCEARLDSPEHCGLCGAACFVSHGEAACIDGACRLARCKKGYGDCDSNSDNGCETSLDSIDNCGACNTHCNPVDDGIAGCIEGKCGVASCIGSFGDCNQDPTDGCEQTLDTLADCAGCDTQCAPANAAGACGEGACVVDDCDGDFVDCNGLVKDGCEAALDSAAHCGACGASCSLPHAIRQGCDTQTPSATCTVDHACPEGAVGCVDGALHNGCEAGFSDCDEDSKNGCETSLERLSDCGGCGNSCVIAHTITSCGSGKCEVTGCAPGYDRCSGNVCDSLATDPQNCGACETECGVSKSKCAGGECTSLTCAPGTADCDGMTGNMCETDLSGASNCGICGNACGPFAHATPACVTGECKIGSCDDGFRDCDGDVANGCEIDIRALNDCGACGQGCAFPNAEASCATGSCVLTACNPGRGNCNGNANDGCEADLKLPADCGACNNDCSQLPFVISSGCTQDKCTFVCEQGRADCDKLTANGCEADLNTSTSCGACGNDCSKLAHVSTAACGGNSCINLVCDEGWGDCNGDASDGCERSLRTLTDCDTCNTACAPAHASGSCSTGNCQVVSCNNGFANCDGMAANGCEAALSSPDHCGSCSKKCGNGLSCDNGKCTCTKDSDCGGNSMSCCDGNCVDTGNACFVFPCIPSTDRPGSKLHCGGCGQVCSLWCCDT